MLLSTPRDQAAARGVEVEVEVVEERPADALLDTAKARDARVIVVGSRGEGPIKGAILGSTPHKLLQVDGSPGPRRPEP